LTEQFPATEAAHEQQCPSILHVHATTWHDGGAALLRSDGQITALAAERVGDRYKHSWNSGLASEYLASRFGKAIEQNNFVDPTETGLEESGHHFYHAASTYYGSGFKQAAVLVIDGQGPEMRQRASTSIWYGEDNELTFVEAPYLTEGLFAPGSIGHFYTAVGALAGMTELHEEGKTMGLASYGQPSQYIDFFRKYVQIEQDGNYSIDPKFVYATLGNTLGPVHFGWEEQPAEIQAIWEEFVSLRGRPVRQKGEEVTQDDADIAYAGQVLLEELVLGAASRAKELTNSDYLCLAGGVALNSVANGKIVKSRLFKDVFIFPAAGDDGQAIGKLFADIKLQGLDIDTTAHTAYYGPEYSPEEIDQAITEALTAHPDFELLATKGEALIEETVRRLISGQVVGWFQGRSELGPRALGNRSILADPRHPAMRDYINTEVKHRELYRPFAPVVPEERVSEFFAIDRPSPFMLLVADVKPEKRDLLPAITHVDGTARVQTVNRVQNALYYDLVTRFGERTGIPVLLNTSFNDKGEPIVETPADALHSFGNMHLDALVIGDNILVKKPPLNSEQ
jgi:carbamoyltransferase